MLRDSGCDFVKVRRLFAASIIASGALASAAHAGEFDGVTLRVATWGGPWGGLQEEVLVPKMEAMGAKVEFVSGSPQANIAKLIAARGAEPPFDVLEIIDVTLPSMVLGDLLNKIDLTKIPNKQHISGGRFDEYKVGTWFAEEGICYNRDKFVELGLEAPGSYRDLAEPKLKGRVMIPDINAGLTAITAINFTAGGTLQDVDPGLELISSFNALKFWKSGSEALAALSSGDIYAAVMHAGWCVRAHNAGIPVSMAHPEISEGVVGVVKQGWMGIVKGTKNAAAAEAWINLFLDTEFQTRFAKERGVVPENVEAMKNLSSDETLKELLILEPADVDRMLRVDYQELNLSEWNAKWNRMVSR